MGGAAPVQWDLLSALMAIDSLLAVVSSAREISFKMINWGPVRPNFLAKLLDCR